MKKLALIAALLAGACATTQDRMPRDLEGGRYAYARFDCRNFVGVGYVGALELDRQRREVRVRLQRYTRMIDLLARWGTPFALTEDRNRPGTFLGEDGQFRLRWQGNGVRFALPDGNRRTCRWIDRSAPYELSDTPVRW